jgi:acetoin utilization protein AcuB
VLIQQLISGNIPILHPADTGTQALALMDNAELESLPLISDDGQYVALAKETDLLDWNAPETPLSGAYFLQFRPAVTPGAHPYEALRIANASNLDVVPVVEGDSHYLGSVSRTDLLQYLASASGLDNPGGIIVLEVSPNDYSLWDIARILENEGVIILSSHLRSLPDTGKLEVTLKTNRTDLQGAIQSFERHEYTVKHVFGDTEGDDDLMNRYNLLMTYINM